MQKNIIHRITALTMALLLLSSSVGFSMDLHFCKGQFKSLNFFTEANNCHTALVKCPRHAEMAEKAEQKDCCSNKTIEIEELDEDFSLSTEASLNQLQVEFLSAFVLSLISKEYTPSTTHTNFSKKEFIPIPRDTYVLNEAFLL